MPALSEQVLAFLMFNRKEVDFSDETIILVAAN